MKRLLLILLGAGFLVTLGIYLEQSWQESVQADAIRVEKERASSVSSGSEIHRSNDIEAMTDQLRALKTQEPEAEPEHEASKKLDQAKEAMAQAQAAMDTAGIDLIETDLSDRTQTSREQIRTLEDRIKALSTTNTTTSN